jgi:HD-like signal output (HDOD) protein
MHQSFQAALQMRKTDELSLYEAEKMTMGFTHEETGEYLMDTWKLPQPLIAVVGFHHTPLAKKGNAPLFTLVSIVHIADIIVSTIELGSGGDPFIPSLSGDCWKQTGLEIKALESIIADTERSFNEMIRFLLPDQNKKETKK